MFTDVEIMSTSEVNIVAKAKRYGRWWLLKGLKKEVAGEAGNQQRLREGDTFECSLIIEVEPLYLDNLKQGEQPAIAYVAERNRVYGLNERI